MLLVALTAAASAHSVTGAFGYALGRAPGATATSCYHATYPSKATSYICPGDGFFQRISIRAQRNQVTDLTGMRTYRQPREVALRTCSAELARVAANVRRTHPALLPMPMYKAPDFWLSEAALDGRVPTGRSIIGKCSVLTPRPGGDTAMLSLTYALSTHDKVTLINQDKAGK